MNEDRMRPMRRLTGSPVFDVALLVEYAGVRVCAARDCDVRWVGGHGLRVYCSGECAEHENNARRKDRRHQVDALGASGKMGSSAAGRGDDEGSSNDGIGQR